MLLTSRILHVCLFVVRGEEDDKWLTWMQKQFEDIAGEDGELDLNEFKKALGVKKASARSGGSAQCLEEV